MIDPRSVFVGREAEAQAYAQAVLSYAHRLQNATAGHGARSNLVVFHGRPGIGKTELMVRLCEWTDGAPMPWGRKPLGERRPATVSISLAEGLDVPLLLHRLRRAVAGADVRTPAFDIGLLEQWLKIAPLEGELTLREAGMQLGPIDVATAIEGVAKAVLAGAGLRFGTAGLTVDFVRKRTREIRESRERRRIERECRAFPSVLAELKRGDDARTEASLGALLDWDLDQLGSGEPLCVVVFVDAFDARSLIRAAALNRLVHETPRVFWVIAGREPLDWAESPPEVYPYYGPGDWAGLADQHRLGELAPQGVRQAVADAVPGADDGAAEAVATAAQGYPLAVGLAVGFASKLIARGEAVDAARLGESFAGIVLHVAEGLSPPSRKALNAASLVGAFDLELLQAALPLSEGEAIRFADESFVSRSAEGPFPFSLHEVIRRAVRDAPVGWEDTWGKKDWTAAGGRMLDALHGRLAGADAEERVAFIGAAFDIASELDCSVEWLLEAARETPNKARLTAAFEGRGRPRAAWPKAFAACVMAWAPRDAGARAEAFGALAAHEDTPDDIRAYARRAQAYGLRSQGQHHKAAEIFSELLDDKDQRDHALLLYQYGLSLIHLGRFGEADDRRRELERLAPGSSVVQSFARRLYGEIRLQHGDLAPAVEATAARAALFEGAGSRAEQWNGLELRTAEARQRALLAGAGASDFVESIIERTDRAGALALKRSALCSKAICVAGSESVAALVEGALAVGREIGVEDLTYHEALARTFDAAVTGDADGMRRAFEDIERSPRAQDARWIRPMKCWRAMTLGEPAPRLGVKWLESEEAVIANWTGLVRARARDARA